MLLIILFKIIVTGIVLAANYLFWKADQNRDIFLKIFVVIGLAVALLIEILIAKFFLGKEHVNLLASFSLAILMSAVFPLIQFFVKLSSRIQKSTLDRMNVNNDWFYRSFLQLCYFGITAMQLVVTWVPAILGAGD